MNNNYENLPAVLNANQLAAALGISRAGAYQLLDFFHGSRRHILRRRIGGKQIAAYDVYSFIGTLSTEPSHYKEPPRVAVGFKRALRVGVKLPQPPLCLSRPLHRRIFFICHCIIILSEHGSSVVRAVTVGVCVRRV